LLVRANKDVTIETDISVAAVASSAVVPEGFPPRLFPDRMWPQGRLAIFGNGRAELTVIAEHRNAAGERLLGHGFEDWSIEGGTLSELADYEWSEQALRRIVTLSEDTATISIGRGQALELDQVAPGSTAAIALLHDGERIDPGGTLHLPLGTSDLHVLAFTADGRYILGGGENNQLAATESDRPADPVSTYLPRRLISIASGTHRTTELSVVFDGVRGDFLVEFGDPR
jgi:hypothetical protein